MGKTHYITSPKIQPVLPAKLVTEWEKEMPMYKALKIARGVLLEAIDALKAIPGGAKRTQYSLERACYHLQRVKIQPLGEWESENEEGRERVYITRGYHYWMIRSERNKEWAPCRLLATVPAQEALSVVRKLNPEYDVKFDIGGWHGEK